MRAFCSGQGLLSYLDPCPWSRTYFATVSSRPIARNSFRPSASSSSRLAMSGCRRARRSAAGKTERSRAHTPDTASAAAECRQGYWSTNELRSETGAVCSPETEYRCVALVPGGDWERRVVLAPVAGLPLLAWHLLPALPCATQPRLMQRATGHASCISHQALNLPIC